MATGRASSPTLGARFCLFAGATFLMLTASPLSGWWKPRVVMTTINLTPSQENYLEWIYRLETDGDVQVSALASKLGVQLPSVSRAVRTLAGLGLVEHESYGTIHLTRAGREVAEEVHRRDRCLTSLLVDVLGVSPREAAREVHRLEHVISGEVLTRLETLVDFAVSSGGWIKRLRLRIKAAEDASGRQATESKDVTVGESKVHGGREHE